VAESRSGERKQWSGFGVRRALDLPENLFTMHRMRRADGVEIVRFIGRGWGHGVGLCQNGAYGLARSGLGFEEILKTYYSGVSITPWDGRGSLQ
jgi:stage II sporulation protein D